VALCIAGQFRNHFSTVFSGLNASLMQHHSVDVFVDTWDLLGQSAHGPRSSASMERLNPNWFDYYPRLTWLRVERFPPRGSEELHGITMPAEVRKAGEPHFSSGTLPNAWKMMGCSTAIAEWEQSRRRPYDAVIKIRPDETFWSDNLMRHLDAATHRIVQRQGSMQLYHSGASIDSSFQVSDKYAVGTSPAMHYYLSVWKGMPTLWKEWATRRQNSSARLVTGSTEWKRIPVGERLLRAHMRGATFPFTTFI